MLCQKFAIAPKIRHFAHRDAYRLFDVALRTEPDKMLVLDLRYVEDVTTSAFARLVLLRRELLRRGRDLQLTGLRDRAAKLYEVNRLETVLPLC